MRLFVLCLAMPFFLALSAEAQKMSASSPLIYLSEGILKGQQRGDLAIFEGIPFAAPPVGPLRWREPQPVEAWSGIRDATKPSYSCMQDVQGTDGFMAPLAATYGVVYSPMPVDSSEDCLYLNVWTPGLHSGSHLPVMVWLHGGSNRVGSGSESSYDGTALASHGIIVVTVNYRLGVMGFFAHPELTAESPHHASGNYGLLDQLAALHWVQQNIAQFGGDPGNVTLFGESAGSIDATTLMASPLSKKLFRRLIAESGPAFGVRQEQSVAQMEPLGVAVGAQAGAQRGAQLAVLRKLPVSQIAEMEKGLVASTFKGVDPAASIVDGWLLPQSPARAFALGQIQPADFLGGLNAREFSAFRVAAAASTDKNPANRSSLSERRKHFADVARPLYGDSTDKAINTYFRRILFHGASAIDQASNDIVGACPVGAEAALVTSAGRHAFVYSFDRSVPGEGESELGAFHSLEVPYVFGTFQARTFSWLPFSATDHKLSETIQAYWTNFAKSGDPNAPGLPHWTAWTADHEAYMSLSQSGDAIPQQHFSPMYCDLSPDHLMKQLANN